MAIWTSRARVYKTALQESLPEQEIPETNEQFQIITSDTKIKDNYLSSLSSDFAPVTPDDSLEINSMGEIMDLDL